MLNNVKTRAAVTRALRRHYRQREYSEAKSTIGLHFFRPSGPETTGRVYFNVIQNSPDCVRYQPSLGVTIRSINQLHDQILRQDLTSGSEHAPTGGSINVDGLLPESDRRYGGWNICIGDEAAQAAAEMAGYVGTAIERSGVFRRLLSASELLDAVESEAIPFLYPMPAYLCAMWMVGRSKQACEIARNERARVLAECSARGLEPSPQETTFFDRYLDFCVKH